MTIAVEPELGGVAAAGLLAAMAARIGAARRVVLTTHVFPDGDAVGSELGLALALRRLGKEVRVLNDHPSPQKYAFIDPHGLLEVLPPDGAWPADLRFDLGILLDTSEPSRTGRLEAGFFAAGLERICLDHHPGPASPRFAVHWVAPQAAATGNLVLRLLDCLGVPLDRELALPLFVAIATDTGWFRFSNTRGATLRDAARLVETGLEVEPIHQRIYEDSSPARLLLLGRLLAGLKVELGGRFVWSLLDRSTLATSGVPLPELDGFSEALKAARDAEVTAAVIEVELGEFKVSLRSRGAVAVDGIARFFGGGGHEKAAGFRRSGSLGELLKALRERVTRALGPA